MIRKLLNDDIGFTLIEVLTTLTLIVLIFGLLLSGLIFANTVEKKTKINQKLFYEERYINLYFQKQILESEHIFIKNNRVYLQDLETPNKYYNFYRCVNGKLRRYKVHASNLKLIGAGSNSQLINNVIAFSLVQGENNELVLSYTLYIDEIEVKKTTIINYGKSVEYV